MMPKRTGENVEMRHLTPLTLRGLTPGDELMRAARENGDRIEREVQPHAA